MSAPEFKIVEPHPRAPGGNAEPNALRTNPRQCSSPTPSARVTTTNGTLLGSMPREGRDSVM